MKTIIMIIVLVVGFIFAINFSGSGKKLNQTSSQEADKFCFIIFIFMIIAGIISSLF